MSSDAPEWLWKLEEGRREKTRTKLGHEAGMGAPCNECKNKCPGLDLHFWRKVCRNCKCRKDQHLCPDDDLTGWAQFEILGQIRSKPAYIKIKALETTVQLEWVPPNAAPDVISDYMEKLGSSKIPIVGSEAATKRKQRLEFQVPPHDLDAALCDNLTDSEAHQLQQYVQKIRENCVGQGSVVRVGNVKYGTIRNVALVNTLKDDQICGNECSVPVEDNLLGDLLAAEKLTKAVVSKNRCTNPTLLIVFSDAISTSTKEFEAVPMLSKQTKQKLCGLDSRAVQNLVNNGPMYDKILAGLRDNNFDISRDAKLGPIADFRKEYIENVKFKNEIDEFCRLTLQMGEASFHSPLQLKNATLARFGEQLCQETPMRKVKFGGVSTVIFDCGLPANIDYEKDPIFTQILTSDSLKRALRSENAHEAIAVSDSPMLPNFVDNALMNVSTKQNLKSHNVNMKALQSFVLNAPFYDRILQTLDSKRVNYDDCKLLAPLKQLNDEFNKNQELYEDVQRFVAQMPDNIGLSFISPQDSIKTTGLTNSQSNDSGFDSKPPTPNCSYFPNLPATPSELSAFSGRFMSIPSIADMPMYPSIGPSAEFTQLPQSFENMQITSNTVIKDKLPTLQCRECKQSINFGEVVVKAERAGKEIAWHPECFKCHECHELLADLVYFFHGGQVYCGRDLAIKLKIPRCKACDELIFTKEYTAAEDTTFHIKHFCCYHCDMPLAGQQYIPDESSNMPLCLKCYDEFFAVACRHCQKPIGPADQGVVWGKVHWHGSCFNCAGVNCNKSLIGGRFCVKNNLPFCSPNCVRSIIN